MKNTIITTSILIAASTAFANATDVVGKPAGYSDDTSSLPSFYPKDNDISGFGFNAGGLDWNSNFGDAASISLKSINLSAATKPASGNVYAFVYELSGDTFGNIANDASSWTKVGTSTNSTTWSNGTSGDYQGSGTWNFENLSLDVTKYYCVAFSSSSDSFTSTTIGCKFGTTTAVRTVAIYGNAGASTTYGTTANFTLNGSVDIPIPEPSMFGVLAGLGALALVGSRRRRK